MKEVDKFCDRGPGQSPSQGLLFVTMDMDICHHGSKDDDPLMDCIAVIKKVYGLEQPLPQEKLVIVLLLLHC